MFLPRDIPATAFGVLLNVTNWSTYPWYIRQAHYRQRQPLLQRLNPMPVMLTEEDLSLRRLPEVSDYSFSFQIPTSSIPKGDDLMADDNTFFEGTNNSILATPAPFGRATIRPPSLNFTSGPSVLGPSSVRQEQRTASPSKPPSLLVAHPELQTLQVHGTPVVNKGLRRFKTALPVKEDTNQAHQDREELQEQHSCPSANATTSTIPHNMAVPPVFAEQPSPELRLEVRHSEIDLFQIESSSCPASRTTYRENKEPEKVARDEGSRKKTTPRQSTVVDRPRRSTSQKYVKRVSALCLSKY